MNGSYIVTMNSWNHEKGYEQIVIKKDPASEPWDDVRGVLESKFIRIGNVVLNAQEILVITYEETSDVA